MFRRFFGIRARPTVYAYPLSLPFDVIPRPSAELFRFFLTHDGTLRRTAVAAAAAASFFLEATWKDTRCKLVRTLFTSNTRAMYNLILYLNYYSRKRFNLRRCHLTLLPFRREVERARFRKLYFYTTECSFTREIEMYHVMCILRLLPLPILALF